MTFDPVLLWALADQAEMAWFTWLLALVLTRLLRNHLERIMGVIAAFGLFFLPISTAQNDLLIPLHSAILVYDVIRWMVHAMETR